MLSRIRNWLFVWLVLFPAFLFAEDVQCYVFDYDSFTLGGDTLSELYEQAGEENGEEWQSVSVSVCVVQDSEEDVFDQVLSGFSVEWESTSYNHYINDCESSDSTGTEAETDVNAFQSITGTCQRGYTLKSTGSGGSVVTRTAVISSSNYYVDDSEDYCESLDGQSTYLYYEGDLTVSSIGSTCLFVDSAGYYCEVQQVSQFENWLAIDNGDDTYSTLLGEYEYTGSECDEDDVEDEIDETEDSDGDGESDNCISNDSGTELCMDDDGGSEMCSTDSSGDSYCVEDGGLCISDESGSMTCYDDVDGGSDCITYMGETTCFNDDGEAIDEDDPDNPENGGNADGDSTNDLLDPDDETDELTDQEYDEKIADRIADGVGDYLETYLDGSVDDSDLENITDLLSDALPTDDDGVFITQEEQAEEQIDSLEDFTNLYDASDDVDVLESAVTDALGFSDPSCSKYSVTFFSGTALGAFELEFECSYLDEYSDLAEWVLWLCFVFYAFFRIAIFNFGRG